MLPALLSHDGFYRKAELSQSLWNCSFLFSRHFLVDLWKHVAMTDEWIIMRMFSSFLSKIAIWCANYALRENKTAAWIVCPGPFLGSATFMNQLVLVWWWAYKAQDLGGCGSHHESLLCLALGNGSTLVEVRQNLGYIKCNKHVLCLISSHFWLILTKFTWRKSTDCFTKIELKSVSTNKLSGYSSSIRVQHVHASCPVFTISSLFSLSCKSSPNKLPC